MREPLERERGVTDVGELGERGDGAAGEFDLAREFVGNAGGGLAGLKDDVIGGGGDGPRAALAEADGVGGGRFRVWVGGEVAGPDGVTGGALPREAGAGGVAAGVAERFGQALAVVDRGLGGIGRAGEERTELGVGDLPHIAAVTVAPALAPVIGGVGGVEEIDGEFAVGEVEHGREGDECSMLLFSRSIRLSPRGGRSRRKETDDGERERTGIGGYFTRRTRTAIESSLSLRAKAPRGRASMVMVAPRIS